MSDFHAAYPDYATTSRLDELRATSTPTWTRAATPTSTTLAPGWPRPEPAHRVQQRGLARPAPADDRHELAAPDAERDSAQDQLSGPDLLAHVTQGN
jgi:hypothetical protein